MAAPTGQPFAYQRSPSTLGVYVVITRGADYPLVDMRDVTSVSLLVTQPNQVQVTWTLLPDAANTSATVLYASRAFAAGDTALLGNAMTVATPYIGSTALPPCTPTPMPIRGPALS